MFSYYGSKSKIANLYPKPLHRRIVEPFAGSARYALLYWQYDVFLIDAFPVVTQIWRYLQQASPADIMRLPNTPLPLHNYKQLSETEALFLGFCWNRGNAYPGHGVGAYVAQNSEAWMVRKKKISEQLQCIKHWTILDGDYSTADTSTPATWFIDPPYQFGGHKYAISNKKLDYSELAAWIGQLKGQRIVCENSQANWLPFVPLKGIQGALNTNTMECIYTGEPRPVQTSLFSPEKALQT